MENLSSFSNFVYPIIGVFGGLVGFIWKSQSKRIDNIQEVQDNCPINSFASDIAEIKNDIKWLKNILIKK